MNFNIDAGYYIKLIRQITKEPIIDFEKVKQDQLVDMSTFDIFLYNTKKTFIRNFRKLSGKQAR
jgi:hypothetical protein